MKERKKERKVADWGGAAGEKAAFVEDCGRKRGEIDKKEQRKQR